MKKNKKSNVTYCVVIEVKNYQKKSNKLLHEKHLIVHNAEKFKIQGCVERRTNKLHIFYQYDPLSVEDADNIGKFSAYLFGDDAKSQDLVAMKTLFVPTKQKYIGFFIYDTAQSDSESLSSDMEREGRRHADLFKQKQQKKSVNRLHRVKPKQKVTKFDLYEWVRTELDLSDTEADNNRAAIITGALIGLGVRSSAKLQLISDAELDKVSEELEKQKLLELQRIERLSLLPKSS
jgi:hypothetical protein